MMEGFKELLLKKQKEQLKKPVDGDKLKAKAKVMKELSDLLSEDMGNDIKGLKKVTIASNSKEGLEEGIDKAKELLDAKKEDSSEEMEEECSEDEQSEESMDEEIKKLEEKLLSLKSKKV